MLKKSIVLLEADEELIAVKVLVIVLHNSLLHSQTTTTNKTLSYNNEYKPWLNMIIAHNLDAALNNNGLQPVGPRSVEAFQRTDVDSNDYDLLLVEPRSVQRSQLRWHHAYINLLTVIAHARRPNSCSPIYRTSVN